MSFLFGVWRSRDDIDIRDGIYARAVTPARLKSDHLKGVV